ncbi:TPM domain-containing protein [Lacticaseibacillus daqingensis]|uniref:TPM domain-containing protein n=1 Tax=Lacticaseibacillus daqingensis TaxID=2486014 RepID=UPI000F76A764|nr:TPM domain-containing protein [Lacticaseibacillus daqingensis]
MRKKAWWLCLLPVLLMLWQAAPVAAASLPSRPTSNFYDGLNLLDTDTQALIQAKNRTYQATSEKPQIAVAVVKSSDGAIGDYAPDLFEKWGVGQKGDDNGVLIVYADNDGAQNVRIEVGYGLEGELTDALSGRILAQNKTLLKASDKAKVNRGLRNVFNAVATVIDKKYKFPADDNTVSDATMQQYQEETSGSSGGILRVVVGIFFVLVIAAIFLGGGGGRGGRGGRRGGSDWWLWWLLSSLLSSGRRSGPYNRGGGPWNGGGFGGGGFGGGSSGGGGADI